MIVVHGRRTVTQFLHDDASGFIQEFRAVPDIFGHGAVCSVFKFRPARTGPVFRRGDVPDLEMAAGTDVEFGLRRIGMSEVVRAVPFAGDGGPARVDLVGPVDPGGEPAIGRLDEGMEVQRTAKRPGRFLGVYAGVGDRTGDTGQDETLEESYRTGDQLPEASSRWCLGGMGKRSA